MRQLTHLKILVTFTSVNVSTKAHHILAQSLSQKELACIKKKQNPQKTDRPTLIRILTYHILVNRHLKLKHILNTVTGEFTQNYVQV